MVSNHTGFRITGAIFFIFAWILKIIQTIVMIPFSSESTLIANVICIISFLLIFIALFIGGKRNVLLTVAFGLVTITFFFTLSFLSSIANFLIFFAWFFGIAVVLAAAIGEGYKKVMRFMAWIPPVSLFTGYVLSFLIFGVDYIFYGFGLGVAYLILLILLDFFTFMGMLFACLWAVSAYQFLPRPQAAAPQYPQQYPQQPQYRAPQQYVPQYQQPQQFAQPPQYQQSQQYPQPQQYQQPQQITRAATPVAPSPVQATNNTAAQLQKYKELLDAGVISAEDYEAKKKQLLGL